MKTKKQKGSRGEYEIAAMYQKKLNPHAGRMPLSGAIEYLKGDIKKPIYDGWTDEVKYQEAYHVEKWFNQAKDQAGTTSKPVLHYRRNNEEWTTVVRTKDYFGIREELYDYEQVSEEPKIDMRGKSQFLWIINQIKDLLNKLKKLYEEK